MSDMKCPFCQQELDYLGEDIYGCRNHNYLWGTEELWQELIRTRKALEIAMGFIEKVRNNEDTHIFWIKVANDALEQITALEQKDVK